MRKLGIISCLAALSALLVGCGGANEQQEAPKQAPKAEVTVEITDTVWTYQEDYRDIHLQAYDWDTSITINGVPHTLLFRSVPIDEPFRYVYTELKNDTLFASSVVGNNCTFDFRLYDPADRKVFEKSYTKEDFATETNMFHVAATSGWYCDYAGFYEKFDAFFFDMMFGFPDSDNFIWHPMFLGRNGEIQMQFDDCGASNHCDQLDFPSLDSELLTFCSLIVNSKGDITVIEKPDKEVAGSFRLSDAHALVVYPHEGKPPYRNAQVVTAERGTVHSFDYEGVWEGLGYTVPHFVTEETSRFILVDGLKQMLFVFEGGVQPKKYTFEELPKATEEVMQQGSKYKVYTYFEKPTPDFYEFEGELYKKQ